MRTQKLMWRNIMSLTKSQKVSVLHYSIDYSYFIPIHVNLERRKNTVYAPVKFSTIYLLRESGKIKEIYHCTIISLIT